MFQYTAEVVTTLLIEAASEEDAKVAAERTIRLDQVQMGIIEGHKESRYKTRVLNGNVINVLKTAADVA